jgi:hypothetical protein
VKEQASVYRNAWNRFLMLKNVFEKYNSELLELFELDIHFRGHLLRTLQVQEDVTRVCRNCRRTIL